LTAAFPFQLYRSGETCPFLVNVSDGTVSEAVDLYAVVTYADAEGKRQVRYATSDGKLSERLVRFRAAAQLSEGQGPGGTVRQPSFAGGTMHDVSWWLYALPAGASVADQGELARASLCQPMPTRTRVVSQAYSRPWERFAFLQSMHLKGGARLHAEVSADGRGFRPVIGPDVPADFWQLPGPKLVLIAGLGCSARAWVGNVHTFLLEGRADSRRRGILCYPKLIKHYRHILFFEYPSAGDLAGDEIAGRLRAVMQGARPEDRIDMIGHSMGGVVARHFIEIDGGHRVVDNAVFLESPLNGVSNGVRDGLAGMLPTAVLNGALGAVSPLSKMLRGSPYCERLNAPWRRGEAPRSPTGFGACRYYCVAAGVHGSGRDPRRAAGWFDDQSEAFPTEIQASSALWLPLGGGPVGELDPTGEHELLIVSPSRERDRYIQHVSFIFFMADDARNGTARWLVSRLWRK
jgi:pimeloyl-ACP methyl ester carboxylesterase